MRDAGHASRLGTPHEDQEILVDCLRSVVHLHVDRVAVALRHHSIRHFPQVVSVPDRQPVSNAGECARPQPRHPRRLSDDPEYHPGKYHHASLASLGMYGNKTKETMTGAPGSASSSSLRHTVSSLLSPGTQKRRRRKRRQRRRSLKGHHSQRHHDHLRHIRRTSEYEYHHNHHAPPHSRPSEKLAPAQR